MKLLILTFYYEPDLCAGSFRASSLIQSLKEKIKPEDQIDIVTTMPNRYKSYKDNVEAKDFESFDNFNIYRIKLPSHSSGFVDQAKSFLHYFLRSRAITRKKDYDLVFSTSSRLFTAFLGALISRNKKLPLYLDIRDLFTDTMNSILPKKLKIIFLPVFKLIEKYTFKRASKINIVSEGFKEHIEAIVPNTPLSIYMNGIDEEFFNIDFNKVHSDGLKDKKIILYAGNIGQGQGLEMIVPKILKRLKENIEFWIIGDGGAKSVLENNIKGMDNVKLIPPVNRIELIEYYKKADYLFLHLNDVEAFEKVLPSKIFEYGVTGKPIIAGVQGFAGNFLTHNVDNSIVFNPGDVTGFFEKFDKYEYHLSENADFILKYRRKNIMDNLCDDFLSLVKK